MEYILIIISFGVFGYLFYRIECKLCDLSVFLRDLSFEYENTTVNESSALFDERINRFKEELSVYQYSDVNQAEETDGVKNLPHNVINDSYLVEEVAN